MIDCRGDDLAEAMRFWSGALGSPVRLDPEDPRYAAIDRPDDEPKLLLQAVEHASRVHLDLETDDQEAERARLEAPRRAPRRAPPARAGSSWRRPRAIASAWSTRSAADFPGDAREYP